MPQCIKPIRAAACLPMLRGRTKKPEAHSGTVGLGDGQERKRNNTSIKEGEVWSCGREILPVVQAPIGNHHYTNNRSWVYSVAGKKDYTVNQ